MDMTILYNIIGYFKWESETSIDTPHANKDTITDDNKDNSQEFLRNNNNASLQRRQEEQVRNNHDENSKRDKEIDEFWNSTTPSTDSTANVTDDDESVGPYVVEEEKKEEEELKGHNNEKGDGNESDEMSVRLRHVRFDLDISHENDSDVSNVLDLKPKDHSSGECHKPPSPSQSTTEPTEPTEPTEFVYDLSRITDEPILYRRDQIQTEEIVPSSSSKWKWIALWSNNNNNNNKKNKEGSSSNKVKKSITSVKGGCICGGVDLNMI